MWVKASSEECYETASDCVRLDRCGDNVGDVSTCLLLTRLSSGRTMPGIQRSLPASLRSCPVLWTARLRSDAVL
jgi:hypothetical protein